MQNKRLGPRNGKDGRQADRSLQRVHPCLMNQDGGHPVQQLGERGRACASSTLGAPMAILGSREGGRTEWARRRSGGRDGASRWPFLSVWIESPTAVHIFGFIQNYKFKDPSATPIGHLLQLLQGSLCSGLNAKLPQTGLLAGSRHADCHSTMKSLFQGERP